MSLVSLIPAFPLLGFIINGLFGKHVSKLTSGILGAGSILIAFVLALICFINQHPGQANEVILFPWIQSGSMDIHIGLLMDPLSILFTLIITGIGFLIHVYSMAYMHTDEGYSRFFTYLNLFVFFMLLLVLGNSLVLTFVGWEGVGLCSYLLIGFWFTNSNYNAAARKAFVMNRIGDLGFLLGIMLVWVSFGRLDYAYITTHPGLAGTDVITGIAILLFIGAIGKSAQIPLYTWLPDAMAGPTPVSALIHAATMVTAGIYMVVRMHAFYALSDTASALVAIIGGATALMAALIGVLQNDIKKILAYSTVSQLGLMFLGLGAGAYTASVFHVTTHAFFKALLFLGAGSVIHAMGGEQDIRFMGGLKKHIRITFITMLIGTIAISGVPPFSGFFSKDEILASVYAYSPALWLIGICASLLTSFYMFRMLFLVFYDSFRGSADQLHHLHESPKAMTIPLMVLAVLSVGGGVLGLPEFWHMHHALKAHLQSVLPYASTPHLNHSTEWMLMVLAVSGSLATIYFTYMLYIKYKVRPEHDASRLKFWQKLIQQKFYVDELYDMLFRKPLDWCSHVFYNTLDLKGIHALVNNSGKAIRVCGSMMQYIQNGKIGSYLMAMAFSIILVLFLILVY